MLHRSENCTENLVVFMFINQIHYVTIHRAADHIWADRLRQKRSIG